MATKQKSEETKESRPSLSAPRWKTPIFPQVDQIVKAVQELSKW